MISEVASPSFEFFVEIDPPERTCGELAALAPEDPWFTAAYLHAKRRLGTQPVVMGLRSGDGALVSGCAALMKWNFLFGSLEIPFLPDPAQPEIFWEGVLRFCRRMGLFRLSLSARASSWLTIPRFAGKPRTRNRCEYLLDLRPKDFLPPVSPGHMRNIRRAEKTGLRLDRAVSPEACGEHVRLVNASMERRRNRGEHVPNVDPSGLLPYLREGAGELFRAALGAKILASVLVLKATRGAYYQSAGASPEGMSCGASHFLIWRIAETLRAEGMTQFNLGGAGPEDRGLHRFKARFGAEKTELTVLESFLGGTWKKPSLAALCFARATYLRFSKGSKGRPAYGRYNAPK